MTKGDLRWIKNWQPQQIGNNMNRFYKKPKPETMKKNRELYRELYKDEIKWFKENLQTLTETKNKRPKKTNNAICFPFIIDLLFF